ncbi:Protein CBG26462 [Caenorhabditis briggsae]|uniref:Protein CBG26462 n=1 Tax=Caenorhabditis briggsae TaxID=6238 RepID=B6IFQ9_CAEBR|nr:Protein CBG26462 [Caenorhabditis briggsae]CAR98739.1 Protein CBG26462 [Caenorhabditis briggsae]
MRCLLVILVTLLAVLHVASAQFFLYSTILPFPGAFNGVPLNGGGMGIIGAQYGSGGPQYGVNGVGSNGDGALWGRRRMMSGMMNPYMGMMYGRR